MLARSPSEVGMWKLSEGCFSVWYDGSVDFIGIIPDMFARVTYWCVPGAKRICVGAVGMDEVWFVVVGVSVMFSAMVTICF